MNINANIDIELDVDDLADELGLDHMIELKLTEKFEEEWSEYFDEKFKEVLGDELFGASPLAEFIDERIKAAHKPKPKSPIDQVTLDAICDYLKDIGSHYLANEVKGAFETVIKDATS